MRHGGSGWMVNLLFSLSTTGMHIEHMNMRHLCLRNKKHSHVHIIQTAAGSFVGSRVPRVGDF